MKTVINVTCWLVLAMWLSSSMAQDDVMIDPNCLADEETCMQRALERQARIQWCQDNPDACEKNRAERKELRKQCKANPDQCDELRREFRQKRAKARKDAMKKWCEDNPETCEQWRAELKEINRECQQKRKALRDKYPDMPIMSGP